MTVFDWRIIMEVSLPFEIGTILKTTEDGIVRHDKLEYYIVGKEILVILRLCYDTDPRLSRPINLEHLKKNWEILE